MIPLVIVLIIGMKLQHVIATLALEHSGVKGPFVGLLLKPRDQLFWFNQPKFLLHVIHFIFFEVSITAFKFIRQ
jgi:mlo protein